MQRIYIQPHVLDTITQLEQDYSFFTKQYVNIWTHLANACYDLTIGKGLVDR